MSKFYVIWLVIACAALYPTFQQFLLDSGYETLDDFFADLLSLVNGLAIVIIPAVLIYLFFFKDSAKESKSSKAEAK